jgi:RloB-like protein
MTRQFYKNILIVCEGEGSEPSYFNHIRDLLLKESLDISITIKPKPKEEQKKDEENFTLREGGKRRSLRKPIKELVLIDIEDEYKAQPTRYVREAQMGLEDGTYAEVWAVFDKDGHPNHEEAFDLASRYILGKKVNIAFTSIAFEYWILLHFESNDTAFVKSMCRQGKEYYYCGLESHDEDCKGVKCVCGRIVTAGYLSYENGKKSFDVHKFHSNVYDAINRATLLRKSYHGETRPIYEFNPYTSVDKLIFRLIQLPTYDFEWFDFQDVQTTKEFKISLSNEADIIHIVVKNISPITQIITQDFLVLFDVKGNQKEIGKRAVLKIDTDIEYLFSTDDIIDFSPICLGIKVDAKHYLITEIPV